MSDDMFKNNLTDKQELPRINIIFFNFKISSLENA